MIDCDEPILDSDDELIELFGSLKQTSEEISIWETTVYNYC